MGYRSGGAKAAASVFSEVIDGAGAVGIMGGATGRHVLIRGAQPVNNGGLLPIQFFPSGNSQLVKLAANDIAVYRIVGAGAGGFSLSQTGSGIGFPATHRRGIAPILPTSLYPNYIFRLQLTAWRDVGNDGIFSVSLGTAGSPVMGAFTSPGFGLEVNGDGNWRAIQRRIAGGVVQQNIDTGLSCTTPRKIELIYTQGASPKLECKLDGGVVLSAVGDANMQEPANTTGESLTLRTSNEGLNGAKYDWVALAKFSISE